MHAVTRKYQYGRNGGISAMGAIVKVEQIRQTDAKAKILPIDIAEAFGAIGRKIRWATTYKKGLPAEMIKHSRRVHRNAKLAPKY